jgi:hypothetical protein
MFERTQSLLTLLNSDGSLPTQSQFLKTERGGWFFKSLVVDQRSQSTDGKRETWPILRSKIKKQNQWIS